ncbi:MAG: ATP-binding protein, partial [Treponema sp.]|nr:ATP-binding protein [Treponema sp.]
LDEKEIDLKNEFELSPELIECILHNRKLTLSKKKEDDDSITSLVRKIGETVESQDFCPNKESKIADIEKKFKGNAFFSQILQLVPGNESENLNERMFFYEVCSDFLRGYDSSLDRTIDDSYACSDDMKFRIAKSFLNGNHILLKADLVEFTEKGCLTNSKLTLTMKAKDLLLGENARLFRKSAKGTDVISPEDIKQKELFYGAENEKEIAKLKASLQDENLCSIQERLAGKGLPKGIAVLLYGAPGTGKTESVYQIARETGREILHVDISKSKSCWFGESEKIIKRIFTDYKQMCKRKWSDEAGKIPILLFNEADGILSKRTDVTKGSVAQTENAMQNIILEEMEKLDGIMVCTTNLADNLDAAFERRFLFKIQFEVPTLDAKKKIWRSKLDWLDDDAVASVANDYDLSGGQIDNIARKIMMDEVITGSRPDIAELHAMCRSERIESSGGRRIGFGG